MSECIDLICGECGGNVSMYGHYTVLEGVSMCDDCLIVEGEVHELTDELWSAIEEIADMKDMVKKHTTVYLMAKEFNFPIDLLNKLISEV